MSTASPAAFLLWAILSVLFLFFLVYHLWCYDKFKCLHWSSGRQPGAFKRVMTYSYLCSIPLLSVFSVVITVIKFKEGFIVTPDHQILPRPLLLYSPQNKSWILPLDFIFSVTWALELVTHLEELAFWLYLLHQDAQKAEWFSSWEYRLWYLGSVVAVMGMPLTTLITRKNIETCDAYIFLVGASGSTITTICFLYVIWRFPAFIAHVKAEGADPTVVVRLATFYQLNLARVVFRFMFTLPLIIIALDGIIDGPHVINRSLFWTDFLHMIAGIGCFVSTTITLLIFFPRSITKEAGYRPKAPTIAASSPKSTHSSPNLAYYNYYPDYVVNHPDSAYPEHFANSASPVYVDETRLEDVNVHYPYPHSAVVLSDRTARSMSEETGDWDEENASAEEDDDGIERTVVAAGKKYDGLEEAPPYPSLPPALQVHGTSAPTPAPSPTTPSPVKPTTSIVDPSSPIRERPVSPARNNEHIQTVSAHQLRSSPKRARIPPQGRDQMQTPPPNAHTHLSQVHVAGIHQRHPFPHSLSSPHILTPPTPSSPTTPSHPGPISIDMTPPRPREQRPGHHRRHSSRRVSGIGTVVQSVEIMQGAGRGLGLGVNVPEVDEDSTITLREMPASQLSSGVNTGTQQSRSSLHPYVMTFTSPIDLVDIPPRDEFPRTM